MLEFPQLTIVRRVKAALSLVLLVLAGFQLYQAGQATIANLDKQQNWQRQPAWISNMAQPGYLQVEVGKRFAEPLPQRLKPEHCSPHAEDADCLVLPENPYAWYWVFDEVELLQDPLRPENLDVLTVSGFWLPVVGRLLLACAALGCWKWLTGSAVGEDRTWLNGDWIPTDTAPQRIGFGAGDALPIKESGISRKAVLAWGMMCLLIAGLAVPGLMVDGVAERMEALLILGITGFVVFAVWFSAIRAYSRILYQDRSGLIDADCFGVKRVPWGEIGGMERVNLNSAAQARHRTRWGVDSRPKDLYVHVLSDKQGVKILQLSEGMQPAPAFSALLARLAELGDSRQKKTPDETARLQAEWGEMLDRMGGKPKSLFDRENRILLGVLLLMSLPFVLATAVMCYQNLWFVYVAERTEGIVVEIQSDPVPALLIEYRPGGVSALTIQSDGSESYRDFQVGDKLTVFYQADNPENARIDLFLELWLGTVLMGMFSVIMLLLTVAIARAVTKPMPGMR